MIPRSVRVLLPSNSPREQFAGILFSLMLSAVVQQNFDPSAVLEIVRRTIY